jgi:hypothetical protein
VALIGGSVVRLYFTYAVLASRLLESDVLRRIGITYDSVGRCATHASLMLARRQRELFADRHREAKAVGMASYPQNTVEETSSHLCNPSLRSVSPTYRNGKISLIAVIKILRNREATRRSCDFVVRLRRTASEGEPYIYRAYDLAALPQ